MKILHTADWHIGKKLHKHSLQPDFDLFIAWLCKCIAENQVEVLLVSGDVFDLANPSSEARQQYYKALIKLRRLNCKIIITGGNHDSPAMLNAPKEVLSELDIHIIGGLPDEISQCIVPVKNKDGVLEVVIAALPYLRDADLRTASQGNSYEERLEALRKGIQMKYDLATNLCTEQFPDIPAIGMGHLFAAGAESSESERDIQIGNQAAFNALQFGKYFSYVALGHIHKPQKVNAAVPTYYSGSPIALSFSERKNKNRVLLLDTKKDWQPQSIEIPVFRELLTITGDLDQLQQKLGTLEPRSGLPSLIEIELKEMDYDANKLYELDKLVEEFQVKGYEIVKHRASFENKVSGSGELYKEEQQLEDLNPGEVFEKLIEKQDYETAMHRDLLSAFNELLEEVHQTTSN